MRRCYARPEREPGSPHARPGAPTRTLYKWNTHGKTHTDTKISQLSLKRLECVHSAFLFSVLRSGYLKDEFWSYFSFKMFSLRASFLSQIPLGQHSQNSGSPPAQPASAGCPGTKTVILNHGAWALPGTLYLRSPGTHLRNPLSRTLVKIRDRDLPRSGAKLTFSTFLTSKVVC